MNRLLLFSLFLLDAKVVQSQEGFKVAYLIPKIKTTIKKLGWKLYRHVSKSGYLQNYSLYLLESNKGYEFAIEFSELD